MSIGNIVATNIYHDIEALLDFAQKYLLLNPRDRLIARGRLYLFLQLDNGLERELGNGQTELNDINNRQTVCQTHNPNIYDLTKPLLDWAAQQRLYESITEMDLFLGNLLGQLMPLASTLEQHFWKLYKGQGKGQSNGQGNGQEPQRATDFFYQISQHAGYIRNDRLAQNLSWSSNCNGIGLEITINLSKPEKDPKTIAAIAAASQKKSGYPQCALCIENEGYPGHLSWAPRFNHRVVELQLNGKGFALQYSPYLYYPEHSILLSKEHKPMQINRQTFAELFDFVRQFPHYMVGSNADLPIVGGSILSHHHFQAGRYEFPMFRAPLLFPMEEIVANTKQVKAGIKIEILQWPMSCIKLSSGAKDTKTLLELASQILESWRTYSDESIGILAQSASHEGCNTVVRHNTITPIVRWADGVYEFFLVLRNNRCSEKHPLGIFHPHAEIHHIKKENIGLIEVMGLAILPGRLKQEMQLMAAYLQGQAKGDEPALQQHLPWLQSLQSKLPKQSEPSQKAGLQSFLQQQIAQVFVEGLRHCA